MYKAILEDFEDLTEEEQMNQPDNGCGKDMANYIRITHNGETVCLESDAMEPEDCIFYRDLGWITTELMRAYQLGYEDCYKATNI